MKLCKCPSCNAELSFSDDREFAFCEYCGSKIQLLDSYVKYEKINRTIDEARILEAQIELEKIKLEKERVEQQERKRMKRRKNSLKAFLYGIMALALELTIIFLLPRELPFPSEVFVIPLVSTGLFIIVALGFYVDTFDMYHK